MSLPCTSKLRANLLLTVLLLLQGCASTSNLDPNDRDVSLAYGYINMSDLPSDLEWLHVKDYSADGKPAYAVNIKDGFFWHIGLKPGSYQVSQFGGTGGIPIIAPASYVYDFDSKGRNATATRISESDVYFMGAYKGKMDDEGFSMKPIEEASEADLLAQLLEFMKSPPFDRYTYQIGMAQDRLEELQ